MRRIAAQILVGALLVAAFGCDRGAQREEPPSVQTTATEPATSEAAAEAETTAAAPQKGQVGAECARDDDCDGFLRCFDDACTVPPAISGEVRDDTAVAVFEKGGEERARFNLELATTRPQMTRGLMFRREMRDDWGMLFVYPSDGPRSFWMKNTLIPLDMVFIANSGQVVGIIEGAEPMTLTPRRVEEPARYVLELTAGTAAKSGVTVGSTMKLENAPDSIQPTP